MIFMNLYLIIYITLLYVLCFVFSCIHLQQNYKNSLFINKCYYCNKLYDVIYC